ncbi:MAG: hypothetical protein DRI92_04035 [Aquificota bacterium]|nr:MAG: hypothetical protein DRI92_04035 [Aquificota bacterium]
MKRKRKKYSAEFKAKVALEAIKGEETLQQLSGRYGVRSTMITRWKKDLIDNAPELFGRGAKRDKDVSAQIEELYRQIGQLKVERDFLARKVGF